MTFDGDLYQDFEYEPRRLEEPPAFSPHLHGVQASSVNIANGNLSIVNYVAGLTLLRPRPVDRDSLLPDHLYVPPEYAEDDEPLPAGSAVFAFLGPEGSGRRTTALRHLSDIVRHGQPIFELYPDWEKPDVSCIPREPDTGYLLNLVGLREPLSVQFHEGLAEYGRQARDTNTRLVIIATEHAWQGTLVDGRIAGAAIVRISRPPSVLQVAHRRIAADPERAERSEWLHETSSVFTGLLRGDEPPEEGVWLAEIILKAADVKDTEARDRFLGWKHKLNEWFGGDDSRAPERRALQIAAAFLDGCPARTVLDAADALLSDHDVNWPPRQGGPLSGADYTERCAAADLDVTDGTVSISRTRPGIDQAVLRHVWRMRPQLVPVLARWISEISRPKGVAEGSLPRLAEVLTTVARSEGPETVINLAHEWLLSGNRHADLAVHVLGRLAVDPRLGPSIRKELARWAKAPTKPERQRAVVAICQGRLGQEYTSVALTRLKYVLDKADDAEVRAAAVAALRDLLGEADLSARVLNAIVQWAAASDSGAPSRTVFLDVLADTGTPDAMTSVHELLTAEGERGEAVRQLLREGWRAVWRHEKRSGRAADVLETWCDAVESEDGNGLPADAVEEIVSAVFQEDADALGDDLSKLIGGTTPFRCRLRTRFVAVVRETARRTFSEAQRAA